MSYYPDECYEELEQENKELRTRVEELDWFKQAYEFRTKEFKELQNRLSTLQSHIDHVEAANEKLGEKVSTLLKASEGMAGAIEGMNVYLSDQENAMGMDFYSATGRRIFKDHLKQALSSLADFRAVKEKHGSHV